MGDHREDVPVGVYIPPHTSWKEYKGGGAWTTTQRPPGLRITEKPFYWIKLQNNHWYYDDTSNAPYNGVEVPDSQYNNP